jgi:hypothetical protein
MPSAVLASVDYLLAERATLLASLDVGGYLAKELSDLAHAYAGSNTTLLSLDRIASAPPPAPGSVRVQVVR